MGDCSMHLFPPPVTDAQCHAASAIQGRNLHVFFFSRFFFIFISSQFFLYFFSGAVLLVTFFCLLVVSFCPQKNRNIYLADTIYIAFLSNSFDTPVVNAGTKCDTAGPQNKVRGWSISIPGRPVHRNPTHTRKLKLKNSFQKNPSGV